MPINYTLYPLLSLLGVVLQFTELVIGKGMSGRSSLEATNAGSVEVSAAAPEASSSNAAAVLRSDAGAANSAAAKSAPGSVTPARLDDTAHNELTS